MSKQLPHRVDRRHVIRAGGTAGLIAVTGCLSGGSGNSNNSGGSENSNNHLQLNMAGGATSSAGYNMGTGYSQLLREKDANLTINAQSTGGTTANVRLIKSENYDFGSTTSTDLLNAANGRKPYKKKYSLQQIFSFTVLPIPICCTTTDHSDIDYIEDLPGTKMAGSPPGTPDAPTLINYLKANNLWKGDKTINFRRIKRDQGLRELAQGSVDATVGYAVNNSPPPWMNKWLSRRDNAKLLFPKNKKNVKSFTKAHPGGVEWDLQLENFGTGWENSAYSDQKSVLTTGIAEPYATTADLQDKAAYRITKLAFKYKDELPDYHNLWTGFSKSPIKLATLFNSEQAPYHPGAAKALKEEGAKNLIVAGKESK